MKGSSKEFLVHPEIEVKDSLIPNAGLGLFAKKDLPEGTIWFKGIPGVNMMVINELQWKTLHESVSSPVTEQLKENLLFYSMFNADKKEIWIFLDASRYCNHSFEV